MSYRPVVNGVATYGTIRLFNTGHPILATLFMLLFSLGPIGMLFWLLVGWSFAKFIILPMALCFSIAGLGIGVAKAFESNMAGWITSCFMVFIWAIIWMSQRFS